MDYIDYDTFQENGDSGINTPSALPEPAPPLILPLNPAITNRFKGLSLLKNKLDFTATDNQQDTDVNTTSKTAEKYAKLSEKLFEDNGGRQDLASELSSKNNRGLGDHFVANANGKSDAVLSNKLANILNTYGLNENKLRDTLEILQQKQDLDLQTLIRSDLLGAMQRRRFRSDIEGELLKEHSSVLREFLPVVKKVEHLGEKITQLNRLKDQLNEFGELDPQLLKQIEDLSNEKSLVTMKRSLLLSFKKNFTLTQYEEHFLTNEPISLEYFQVLHKCKKIHSNCSILLALQNPALGMKIMEKMNKFLDLSYQRISFFLASRLDDFMNECSHYQSPVNGAKELRLMKIAIFYLSNNLKYFDEVTSNLIQSRSKSIVDEFLYQTNNSENFDYSRPIILSAHDPLRYIGDLLAFVHSIIVNEVEFVTTLFQISEDDEAEYERTEFEKNLIELENLQDVNRSMKITIERIIASLSRPLKVKVEQIVRSEKKMDIINKIFNLLDLYKMMFRKQIGDDGECTIFETLSDLKSLCIERVLSVLKEKVTINEKQLESDDWKIEDDSFLPPDWIRDFYSETLSLFDDVIKPEEKVMGMDDELYATLINLLIDKPVELISRQAKINFKDNEVGWKIFLINSLDFIESRIIVIPSLSTEVEKLTQLISTTKEELIQHQYESLLSDSGLKIHQQLIQLIFPIEQIESEDDFYMYSSLIENKLFNKENLQKIEEQIHQFLPVALIDVQQALFKVSSPSISNDIITESSLKFLKLYNVFYKILHILYDEEVLLEWSTLDVATLLGVEKSYDQV
jgi:hypothetical protein